MSSETLDLVMKQVDKLTVDEQLRLVSYTVERARKAYVRRPRRKWSEICGIAPYPLVGEDAQAWVSRTRREADEERERQWRRTS